MRAAFYKGTRPGYAGAYNYVVRAWTNSPYSHVELIFSDGMAGSASFADGGVRLKPIVFDPTRWDFIELPAAMEPAARAWFEAHAGAKYDLLGNMQFILAPFGNDGRRWFCSEACAAALGPDPWRYDPGTLASALTLFSHQPASAGFSLLKAPMPIQPSVESVAGIKYSVLIFAFLGAAVSLSYAKEMTRAQAVTAIVTGTAVAVMAAPVALHYLGLPDTLERAIAFFSGLAAMRAVPVFFSLIDRLRDIKLPWLSDPKE